MTDNEIIKALDCCGFEYGNLCSVCPKYEKDNDFCQEELHNYAIDLINRQKEEIKEWKRVVETLVEQHEKDKAEIDGLRADLKRVCAERDAHICTNNFIKSEAVKEFVENVTYCKYCKNYELMTSNNQHFCNRYGGYVKETDCCSRGYTL